MFNVRQKQRPTLTETFPAPSMGWVQSGNITNARKDQAEVLDNYIPTAQGARLRGGSTEYADLGASVKSLFTYAGGAGEDLLGATETSVFDVERVSLGANTFAEWEGLTSGEWSTEQISSSAGQFLVAVNGSDFAFYYDGSDYNPISTVAVNNVGFDAETGGFAIGETVSGGISGASATVLGITKTSATAGTLRVGTIASGPFQDNEALTGSVAGAATANGASASGSAVTITNVGTDALSQVWNFKRRLFFVEGGSTSAWYLPVDSIGGAATELDLGPVFSKGGALLYGATWSLDSGDGIDDVCVFVSTRGQIAVYQGTDPASASTWALSGVYDVGEPLNKNAHFKMGGDLALVTEDGIIPISQAISKDRAALRGVAVTSPIEDAWDDAITSRTITYPINATLWQSKALLLVGTPQKVGGVPVSYVANARTGAWGRVIGWDVRCASVSDDTLYFGNDDGQVMKADTGGTDGGTAYTGLYVPKFSTCGYEGDKVANHAGITFRASANSTVKLVALSDYEIPDISAPETVAFASGSTWGSGVWGTFVWGGSNTTNSFDKWKTVSARGYSLAPAVLVTSNQTSAFEFEILATRVRYERASVL